MMGTVFNRDHLSDDVFIDPMSTVKRIEGFPEICVSTFSGKIMKKFTESARPVRIAGLYSSNGAIPIYRVEYKGREIALYVSGIGAPACAAGFEEVIAMGARKFVLFGSCGVLNREADGKIIVPEAAVRDEGTSYFYKSPSDEVCMDEDSIKILESVLRDQDCDYIKGKVWTVDAVYRETKELVRERRAQGCIAVDMECSAMLSVAEYRRIPFIQFLFGADNLDGDEWEARDLSDQGLSLADKYMKLALECGIAMQAAAEDARSGAGVTYPAIW